VENQFWITEAYFSMFSFHTGAAFTVVAGILLKISWLDAHGVALFQPEEFLQ